MKRSLSFLLALLLLVSCLIGCEDAANNDTKTRLLSFSQANSIDEMQALDGQEVTIIGYMSTLSPVSGKFMYLMNLPYQSCPFCIPNTTELSNTMAVYAKEGKEFDFTDRAIQVTGTLEFGEYTDEFGYQYGYRIKDAVYKVLDVSDMSDELKLWQQLASTDIITEIYTMFDYVNFLCFWPEYTVAFDSGNDYLYPADALYFIETEGAQYNYGFKEGYFEGIISTIKSVDATAFAELVEIIEKADALCDKAYGELKASNCTQVSEYSGMFNDGRLQYKMNKSTELEAEMKEVFYSFSDWLANWEL